MCVIFWFEYFTIVKGDELNYRLEDNVDLDNKFLKNMKERFFLYSVYYFL